MTGAITNKTGNVVVMPLSSMRQADGSYDFAFAANDIRQWSTSFYTDGICPYTDDLSDGYVEFVNGFTVRVNPFRVNINGTLCFTYDAISLTLEDADPTLPRIDSIIMRRDLVGRRGDLLVKTGTPATNAVPPELVYNRDGICEFLPANVYVTAGVGSLAQSDITDWRKFMEMKAGIEGNVPVRPLGSMEFSGFTPAELVTYMPGWYFMNGDFFPNTSKQAIQLNKLPTDFKNRWGIVNNGSATCVPNFFYEDGRGYFMRAGLNPGTQHNDKMRPIVGVLTSYEDRGHSPKTAEYWSGAFFGKGGANKFVNYSSSSTNADSAKVGFDSSRLGEGYSGEETAPLYIEVTPVIYLGV